MPMLPPALSGQPPIGSAPISVPSGSPGANADGMAMVREAYKLLNDAIPKLPLGSEPHQKILSVVQTLAKLAPPSAEVPGVQQTALRGVMQNAGKNAMLQQVLSSLGGANAGAGAPGGGAMGAGAPMAQVA